MLLKSEILKKPLYKTGQVAKLTGVSIQTVIAYCEQGRIPFGRSEKSGYRLIEAKDLCDYLDSLGLLIDDTKKERNDVIYARVSTHKQAQRGDLDRQIEKIKLYAIEHNVQNLIVKSDVGSGLNDNRKNLARVLDMVQKDQVNRIFISYKDRLTRFGFNYLKQICEFHGTEIVVVSDETNQKSESEELAEDIIALIHSFSGKLYGLRHKIKEGIDDGNKEKEETSL